MKTLEEQRAYNREKTARHRARHREDCCPDNRRSCGKCVRGLLCARCNMGLGHFGDDPSIVESALSYLKGGGAGVVA